jgi:hypothetical protein
MLEKANPSKPKCAQTPTNQSASKPKVPWVPQRNMRPRLAACCRRSHGGAAKGWSITQQNKVRPNTNEPEYAQTPANQSAPKPQRTRVHPSPSPTSIFSLPFTGPQLQKQLYLKIFRIEYYLQSKTSCRCNQLYWS